MVKTTRSIRFDPEALAKAEALDVDVSEVCRKALNRAVSQEPAFTLDEIWAIETALKLKAKSLEDNNQARRADKWRKLSKKITQYFLRKE